ncbi:MAG: NTP transferase domain-containing protein [Calditrichaeota bacterium]|nr:NTP transferase domain-containing protein [Calditrichota bacterium]
MTTSEQKYGVVAAILAGGMSSRMGTPKSGVRLSTGLSVLETVWGVLSRMNIPKAIVGHAHGIDLASLGNPIVVPDVVEQRGPVGALLGLLQSGLGTHYLVVGCDQILLTPDLLQKLLLQIDSRPAVLGLHNDHFSPLPALIPETVIGRVEELLQNEKAAMRDLLVGADARIKTISESELELLRSVNTPQDLAELDHLQKNNSIDQET